MSWSLLISKESKEAERTPMYPPIHQPELPVDRHEPSNLPKQPTNTPKLPARVPKLPASLPKLPVGLPKLSVNLPTDPPLQPIHASNYNSDHYPIRICMATNPLPGYSRSIHGSFGPTHPASEDPLELFTRFLTNELLGRIVTETNRYASQDLANCHSGQHRQRKTNVKEVTWGSWC